MAKMRGLIVKMMTIKDERLKQINEVLNGIKVKVENFQLYVHSVSFQIESKQLFHVHVLKTALICHVDCLEIIRIRLYN